MAARTQKRSVSPYKIRRVDYDDFDSEIVAMHAATELPLPQYVDTAWWLAFFGDHPIAYLGLAPSTHVARAAYLCRVGVLEAHRGNRLQLRLMRVAERFARRAGYAEIVSDTRFNTPSANNFVRDGYVLFEPVKPWALSGVLYWRKQL